MSIADIRHLLSHYPDLRIAVLTDQISPVAVRGTDSLYPFKRIEVSIGPPVMPDLPAWWALSRRVSTVVDRVRNALSTALTRRPQ